VRVLRLDAQVLLHHGGVLRRATLLNLGNGSIRCCVWHVQSYSSVAGQAVVSQPSKVRRSER
jgi:hypothetical protein